MFSSLLETDLCPVAGGAPRGVRVERHGVERHVEAGRQQPRRVRQERRHLRRRRPRLVVLPPAGLYQPLSGNFIELYNVLLPRLLMRKISILPTQMLKWSERKMKTALTYHSPH